MPRKRPAARRLKLLSRNVEITSFSARVSIRAEHRRGEEPFIETGPWLELRGTLEEPVKKDVQEVLFSVSPEEEVRIGTAQPAAVGAILGLRPQMSVVLTWPHLDFDRVWALALSGRLGFAYLAFTEPYYGKAQVVSAEFATDPEE